MTKKLFVQAIIKYLLGVALVGLLIFLPAGTFSFFNGWLFMGILFVPMFFAGIIMMFKNPNLLKSRLNSKERQEEQSIVIKLSGLMFLAGFIVAGLGVRFHWYVLPKGIVIGAGVVFLGAYILYAEVLRENTGESKGNRYGTIWNCQTPDVQRDITFIFVDADCVRFRIFIFDFYGISFYYCQKD